MGKIIFWIVVIFGVLFALRMYNVAKARARRAAAQGRGKPAAQAMVQCVRLRRVPARARGADDRRRAIAAPIRACARQPHALTRRGPRTI